MKENIPPAPDAWRWRKSSYSEPNGGECVELAPSLEAVRDSKNTSGPVLSVRGLPEFVRHLKAGLIAR